jgi:WD40 repeat protein
MPLLPTLAFAQRNPLVVSAILAPDGKARAESVEFANSPGVISIRDLDTGKVRWQCKGHEDAVNTMTYSSDGKMLASCDCSGAIRLWDTATGKEMANFKHEPRRAWSLAFSPSGKMLASSSPSRVVFWEVATGKQRAVIETVGAEVNSFGQHGGCGVVFSLDGKTLAFAQAALRENTAEDWAVRVFDVLTCKERLVLRGHDGAVLGVAFSPNGRTLATCSEDKTIRLWDAETGRQKAILRGHKGLVVSVVFSPDGKFVASWCFWKEEIKQGEKKGNHWCGTELKVWEAATGKDCLTLEPDQPKVNWFREVFALQFSSDSNELVTVTADAKGIARFDIRKMTLPPK